MGTYIPKHFTKRIRELLNKRIDRKAMSDYKRAYDQEYLNMCKIIQVPDSFFYDIETYEQRPRLEILEKMGEYFSVKVNFLLYGD